MNLLHRPAPKQHYPVLALSVLLANKAKRRTLFAQHPEREQNAIVFFGDTILNLLHRLRVDVRDLHPRALVLLIGTNEA